MVIRRWLANLRPRSEAHQLFYKSTSLPFQAAPGEPVQVIDSQADSTALEQFTRQQGFGSDWTSAMLQEGATAFVAVDSANQNVKAMAWITRNPFAVDEIGATIAPAPGAYFFGDFVGPAYRGQKLQKLLVQARLEWTCHAGLPCAVTIIAPGNIASVKSYETFGFVPCATWTRSDWLGRTSTKLTPGDGHPARFIRRDASHIAVNASNP